MSAKKRQELRETSEPRRAFVEHVGGCMVCGENDGRLACHEIAGGTAARPKAVYIKRLWAVLCERHHAEWHDKAKWPPARQLAKRIEWEIVESIEELCAARGDRLVDWEEVLKWLRTPLNT